MTTRQIVRNALSGTGTPLAVTGYTYEQPARRHPGRAPDTAQLQAMLDGTVHELTTYHGLVDDLPDPDRSGPVGPQPDDR